MHVRMLHRWYIRLASNEHQKKETVKLIFAFMIIYSVPHQTQICLKSKFWLAKLENDCRSVTFGEFPSWTPGMTLWFFLWGRIWRKLFFNETYFYHSYSKLYFKFSLHLLFMKNLWMFRWASDNTSKYFFLILY